MLRYVTECPRLLVRRGSWVFGAVAIHLIARYRAPDARGWALAAMSRTVTAAQREAKEWDWPMDEFDLGSGWR